MKADTAVVSVFMSAPCGCETLPFRCDKCVKNQAVCNVLTFAYFYLAFALKCCWEKKKKQFL